MPVNLNRGTNLSYWLAQCQRSTRPGVPREQFLRRWHLEQLAAHGFGHVRLPLDQHEVVDDDLQPIAAAWDHVHRCITWCSELGLKVIVDLHTVDGSDVLKPLDQATLYRDEAQIARFLAIWQVFMDQLGGYDPDLLAYEPLNEPIAADPADWNRLLARIHRAIRERETERSIVIGSNHFQVAETFPDLAVPADDPHLILDAHMYHPFLLTHYAAAWAENPSAAYAVQYPGRLITDACWQQLDAAGRRQAEAEGMTEVHNRDGIRRHLAPVIAVAERTGLPVHIGEFGCFATVPSAARQAWYRDALAVFAELGFAWANWNLKSTNKFGLFDDDDQETDLLQLLGKPGSATTP